MSNLEKRDWCSTNRQMFFEGCFSNQKIRGCRVLSIATRSDGYIFMLVKTKADEVMVKAGCQFRSLGEYRRHVRGYFTRVPTRKAAAAKQKETLAILDLFAVQLKSKWWC